MNKENAVDECQMVKLQTNVKLKAILILILIQKIKFQQYFSLMLQYET